MTSKTKVIWYMKELTEVLRKRQLNKFDVNIGVSGKRGDGKSTFLFHLFNKFRKDGFNQEKHQVYNQDDVIDLLAKQKFGFVWDDEAINSGYKRDFQKEGQKTLIKIVTNYRDSFNIYGSALPFFYSLDKDLRELIFMHVHIIKRGVGVILMPLTDSIHSSDPWDSKVNENIEKKEIIRISKNPNLPFRYHKFTTFAGYIYFGPMTDIQEEKYKEIKARKRAANFKGVTDKIFEKKPLKIRLIELAQEKKLTHEGLKQMCLLEGVRYSSICSDINRYLKDTGEEKTILQIIKEYSTEEVKKVNSSERGAVYNLVPSLDP